jgi:hypothetical protein
MTTATARPKFTAESAQAFEHFSAYNAAILESICPKCKAYQDWYTYNRWQAQGFQVQRGQHGTKLTTYIECQDKDDPKKTYSRPWTSIVFCRHQVAAIEDKKEQ